MKLNIGSGMTRPVGFTNVDKYNYEGYTDYVVDIEHERLPFEDNSVDEIACYEVLEHIGHSEDNPDKIDGLIFAMNEMWRVLKPEGILKGKVPSEGGKSALADPTHKRVFVRESFDYFTGENRNDPERPKRPYNCDYGIKPWIKVSLDKSIRFELKPRK